MILLIADAFPNMRERLKISHFVYFIVFYFMLVNNIALADYESTWNTYYEQPCCGENSKEPIRLRHQKGIYEKKSNFLTGIFD
jgi:hypothetical protein